MEQLKKKTVFLSLGVAAVCGAIGFAILAWSEPNKTPPQDNISVPVNTGSVTQVKSGILGFGETDPLKNNDPYYIKETGGTFQLIPRDPANPPSLTVGGNGYVGIGTTAASRQLDVNGFVNGQKGICIGKQCCSSWGACAILAGCANYNWIQQTEASVTGEFAAIASSGSGVNLVAVANNGKIYVSPDSGASWNLFPASIPATCDNLSSSADGKNFAAIGNGVMYVYTETSGTWNKRVSVKRWTASVFFDGGIIASANDGNIYTSSDLGVNWNRLAGSGLMVWTAISSSADGSSLAAINNGSVYVSNDSGKNWTRRDIGSGWKSVAYSAGGVMAAVGSTGVVSSADSGATWWFERTTVGLGWRSVAASSDGGFLAAVDGSGNVWTNQ